MSQKKFKILLFYKLIHINNFDRVDFSGNIYPGQELKKNQPLNLFLHKVA